MSRRPRPALVHPRLRHAGPAPGLRDLVGETLTPEELAGRFARRGWRPAFWALARLAAILCNDEATRGPRLRQLHDALRAEIGTSRVERLLAARLAASPEIPIVHEAAIYLLEALAVMHGSDDDTAIFGDAELGFLLLAANDYVFDWREPDERELTRAERPLADSCRSLLYNHGGDTAAGVVRGALVLESLPRRTKRWRSPSDWMQLQRAAFGTTLTEYVEALAGPLYLISHIWETVDEDRGPRGPVVDPNAWIEITGFAPEVTRSHFDVLTIDRDRARANLLADARDDGMPIGTTLFHRHPFLRFDDRHFVAASPWVVREHLRVGLWARMRNAARDDTGRESSDWPSAFGDLVEQWCHRVAQYAREDPRFKGRLIIAPSPDDGEIEDIVIVHPRKVALISVKGSMVREDVLRGARCRSRAVAFFDRFFFHEKRGEYRNGAARLLDAKVAAIRCGAHEPDISRHATIYPIIVTYDDLGADNPGGYDYLKVRGDAMGVLRGKGVRPLVCMGVDTFENLMGYCAKGTSLFDILERKARPPFTTARLDVLIEDHTGTRRHRLPQVERDFRDLSQRIQARLGAAYTATRAASTGVPATGGAVARDR